MPRRAGLDNPVKTDRTVACSKVPEDFAISIVGVSYVEMTPEEEAEAVDILSDLLVRYGGLCPELGICDSIGGNSPGDGTMSRCP